MLIGAAIGLALLVGVYAVYDNRDELRGPPRGKELALYILAVLASIAIGIAVAEIVLSNQDICGAPGASGSRCG